jgi:hypothetical protein
MIGARLVLADTAAACSRRYRRPGTATNNGSYPNVFENAKVDGSFGVTSPLILRQYFLSRDNRPAFLVNTLNVTDRTGIVTSSAPNQN